MQNENATSVQKKKENFIGVKNNPQIRIKQKDEKPKYRLSNSLSKIQTHHIELQTSHIHTFQLSPLIHNKQKSEPIIKRTKIMTGKRASQKKKE